MIIKTIETNKIDWNNNQLKQELIAKYGSNKVEKWSTYLNINPEDNPFNYLEEIVVNIMNNKKIPVNELNYLGGRFGRKTFEICSTMIAKFLAVAMKYNLKIAIYGFREFGADIQELKKEVKNALSDLGLNESTSKVVIRNGFYKYKNINNTPYFEFIDGSFIQLKGLYKSNNSSISLKGLSSCKDFDLSIEISEEANEIKENEFQAIRFAIRGAKQELKIKMSNPDSKFQDYVKYCNDRVPMNRDILEHKGQQITIYQEPSSKTLKLFHYTNYTINPFLSKDTLNNFLELKELDPVKYEIWGIGMAGGLETAIFSRYLVQADNDKEFQPIKLKAGLDLGQSDSPTGHPTTSIFIGIDNNFRIKPLAEYFHSNAFMNHKNNVDIASDLIMFYANLSYKYPQIRNGLDIYVDYGAGGAIMIDLINELLATKYKHINYLNFKPVEKSVWFIKDRIDATISLIITKRLLLDENLTPNLIKYMDLMEWKKPPKKGSNYKLEPLDLNDDSWDALCYGIMNDLKQTITTISNDLLLSKKAAKYETEWQSEGDDYQW